MTAAEKFKQACRENGYTARRVADVTGLSLSTVHSYFQGVRYPSRRTKRILIERLEGIEIEKIFNE